MYEIQVRQASDWVPDSLFEDLQLAIFEAERLVGTLEEVIVRVVRECNEADLPDAVREVFYLSGKIEHASGRKSSIRRRKALAGRHIVGIGGLVTVAASVAVAVLVF